MATEIEVHIDALMPPEMAARAEAIGIRKAAADFWTMFSLAILAGAFISTGAIFSTTVATGASVLPYGVARLLAGFAFCLGLILVVVAGAELFTGNNLIIMAWAARKVSTVRVWRNWIIVYLGNFIGALLTVGIMMGTQQYMFSKGMVGLTALNTAMIKVSYNPVQAFFLGIMCNALVCMAVWLCFKRTQHPGQDRLDHLPDHGLRRRGVRAQHREHVLHPDGPAHQTICPARVLGVGRAGQRHTDPDHGGELRQPDLAQLLRQ